MVEQVPLVPRSIRLSRAKIEETYQRMQRSQRARYLSWRDRNEHLELDRSYPLPKLREFYSRVEVTSSEREALHVTRRAIESLTAKSFTGSQGQVAEWQAVMGLIGLDSEHESQVGQRSLDECVQLMREHSYEISDGVRFIRTRSALQALERKYYLTDLTDY